MRSLNGRKGALAALGAGLIVVALTAGSCDPTPSAADKDAAIKASSYDRLQAQEPAHEMPYSPTRKTINAWIDQWGQPGKLAYIYLLQTGNPAPIGYYIFVGLPVSYCTGLTPGEKINYLGSGGAIAEKLPGVDGAYYSGSGCNQYFGVEAGTSTILEFGGDGISYLLSERPLQVKAPPLGSATIEANPPK